MGRLHAEPDHGGGCDYLFLAAWNIAGARPAIEFPIISRFCVLFIEFWRGVPLITVLVMASFMLPFFMPDGFNQRTATGIGRLNAVLVRLYGGGRSRRAASLTEKGRPKQRGQWV